MTTQAEKLREKGPIFFCEKILGTELYQYQKDIINAVFENPRVTVRSGNAAGKTYLAANLILSFLYLNSPSVVISTAPTYNQVEKLIWKEIRTLYHGANDRIVGGLGGTLLPRAPELYLTNKWFAIGLSTNQPERLQGYHEENLLLVVDESSGIKDDIFEAAQRILTSKNTHILQIGNPNPPKETTGNYFYDSFNSEIYKKFNINAFDTINFTTFGITQEDIESGKWKEKIGNSKLPSPYLVTPQWVDAMSTQWGIDSAAYSISVLGEYPKDGANNLIPVEWLRAATQ